MEIVDCCKIEADCSVLFMFSLLRGHVSLLLTHVAWLAFGFVLELPRVAGHDSSRWETSSKDSFWAVTLSLSPWSYRGTASFVFFCGNKKRKTFPERKLQQKCHAWGRAIATVLPHSSIAGHVQWEEIPCERMLPLSYSPFLSCIIHCLLHPAALFTNGEILFPGHTEMTI